MNTLTKDELTARDDRLIPDFNILEKAFLNAGIVSAEFYVSVANRPVNRRDITAQLEATTGEIKTLQSELQGKVGLTVSTGTSDIGETHNHELKLAAVLENGELHLIPTPQVAAPDIAETIG